MFDDDDDGPDCQVVDDTIYFCPECESPNQFGELCGRCQRELEIETYDVH